MGTKIYIKEKQTKTATVLLSILICSVFQDPSHLRYPDVPLTDTASLIGQAVNQLPEGHADYNMAIALVDLVHSLM